MNTGKPKIWLFGEQEQGKLLPITFELLTRGIDLARKRGAELGVVVFGRELGNDEIQKAILAGADTVVVVESPDLEYFDCERFSACLCHLISRDTPEIILAGATSSGRTLMPYLAIKTNTGLTADCTILDIEDQTGNLLQTRPAIGGNIMARIKTPNHRPQMATVRPQSTPPAQPQAGRNGTIERWTPPASLLKSRVKRIAFTAQAEDQSISSAETIVCMGRGIKKADTVPAIQKLAHLLGGAVGATRDVVDRGWAEYPSQIGLSGKTVTPRLYIGIGVSGTIQHLAGMQTAQTIIAINKDPDAQIFKVADVGIVGDLFEVLPVLTEALNRALPGKNKEKTA
jgi:electron transfer flavoprotein alpha subunit